MTTQRPTGVTILAIIQMIGGVLSLLIGISGLFFGGLMVSGVADNTSGAAAAAEVGPLMVTGGIGAIVSGILGLLAGYGLFTLKGWGWTLAMVFSVLNIIHNALGLFRGANIPGAIVGIVISGLILYYLFTPTVKRAFGKT
jgi:uncharacterized membrane protein (DUF2068 family)